MAKPMDLEAYIGRYSGHTKFARLNFIVERCPPLQDEALALLAQTIQAGVNTEIFAKYSDRLGALVPMSWVSQVEANSEARMGKLQGEVTSSRASLNKPRIRNAHFSYGDFLHERGDVSGALKQFTLARDHSSNASEMVEAAMKVIVVAMDFNNLSHIDNQLHKVELSASESPVLQAQLTAARALTCLKRGEFQDAAHKFAQVSPYLGDSLTQLICAEDVALYGTLCTLVSLEHEQVRNILLEPTSNFRNFVDLDPLVGDLATFFVEGDYGKVMSWLSDNKARLMLDIHLAEHIPKLFQSIQDRCILKYVSPYVSLSLASMAESFNMDITSVESSVATLISDARLNARIDSAAKTVHVVSTERRAESFAKVAKLSSNYIQDMQGLLLRMSCLEKDVVVINSNSLDGYRSNRRDRDEDEFDEYS